MGLLCQPSRVCAVLQPSNAGLGVNQTEKEKGFGPNHSWGMNVSILCRHPVYPDVQHAFLRATKGWTPSLFFGASVSD